MGERRAAPSAAEPGAAEREVVRSAARACARVAACLRDLARGVSGTHAYDQYVAHCRVHHPDRPVPTREEFFRRELAEKWDGVRRCC